jgi:hypothetical protein
VTVLAKYLITVAVIASFNPSDPGRRHAVVVLSGLDVALDSACRYVMMDV